MRATAGDLLRRARLGKGLSMETVAAEVGISYQQVQKYEKGANRIGLDTWLSLTRAIGVDPSDLMRELQEAPAREPFTGPLYDAEAAWEALTPDQQREIGVCAIISSLGIRGEETAGRYVPAYSAANFLAGTKLCDLVLDHCAISETPVPRPDLNEIGIRCCTGCGCTEQFGCEQGCSWVGPTLCSSCRGPA